MWEVWHARALARLMVVGVMVGAWFADPASATARARPGADELPACRGAVEGAVARREATGNVRLADVLDQRGWLVGHVLRLGGERSARVHLGRSAFAEMVAPRVVLIGERHAASTTMRVADARGACEYAQLLVPGLVFGVALDPGRGVLYYSLVAPRTRAELGVWRVDLAGSARPLQILASPMGALASVRSRDVTLAWDHGRLGSMWCSGSTCIRSRFDPATGRVDRAAPVTRVASEPSATLSAADPQAFDPEPVPENGANRWPLSSTARYAWHADDTPPSWMRPALSAAADDASATRRSQAPVFRYEAGASGVFRYTSAFPIGPCTTGIACASHDIPDWWVVRLRPNGYEFRWGTLHWCQADERDGCFDVERTALHELGHIVGLGHWDEAGMHLHATDSVMNSIIPARGQAGSLQHAFGPCDIARLQERYDVVSTSAAISTCNDVDSTLVLTASTDSVGNREPVTFVATLSIPDRDGYGRLGGNALSGRDVQLRRRPASGGSWTTFWMSSGPGAGTYTLTVQPNASYDYQAVFPRPDDEGLGGSSSAIVTVRATNMCGSPPCAESVPL